MSNKPIEIKDDIERRERPEPTDIAKAEELARAASPLLAALMNAKADTKRKAKIINAL